MKNPTPEALALADDVATMANQLSALATRAQALRSFAGAGVSPAVFRPAAGASGDLPCEKYLRL